MKAHSASLLNAILLVTLSLWGYLASDNPSPTALIPLSIGIILLFLNKGIKGENKVIAHLAVMLTFLILIGLIMPFKAAMGREDNPAIIRVGIMLISTVVAMVMFVKSFIDARKRNKSKK